MTCSSMVVNLGRGEEQPEWFSLVSFGRISEVLARHDKGDMVAVSGRISKSTWKAKDGTVHTGYTVLVDGIASARTVRSGKAKAKCDDTEAATFDDAIPFRRASRQATYAPSAPNLWPGRQTRRLPPA